MGQGMRKGESRFYAIFWYITSQHLDVFTNPETPKEFKSSSSPNCSRVFITQSLGMHCPLFPRGEWVQLKVPTL